MIVQTRGLARADAYAYGYSHGAGFAGMFSFLGDIKDAVGDVLETARDVVTVPVTEIWEHLPKEIRALAMQIGPMVAEAYLPGFGGTLAEAATAILEGDRRADLARRQLAEAQARQTQLVTSGGQLVTVPRDLALGDPAVLQALARAPQAPARPGGAEAALDMGEAGGAVVSGGLLALAVLL